MTLWPIKWQTLLAPHIGPGIAHLTDLHSKGIEAHGIEAPELHVESALYYIVNSNAHDIVDAITMARQIFTKDFKKASSSEEKRFILMLKDNLDFLENLGLQNKLISRYVSNQERAQVKAYLQEKVLEARTKEWMVYVANKTPLMTITGIDHLAIQERIAQEQGIKFYTGNSHH